MKTSWMLKIVEKLAEKAGLNEQRADNQVPEVTFTDQGEENCRLLHGALQFAVDVVVEVLGKGQEIPRIVYLKGLVDDQRQHHDLIRPLQALQRSGGNWDRVFETVSIGERKPAYTLPQAIELVMDGWTLVSLPGKKGFICFKTDRDPGRQVDRAENQTIVIGPQDAFTESLESNLSLVRKRLRTPKLLVDVHKLGRLTQTKIAILAITDIVNDEYLAEIKRRITEADLDGALDSGTLSQLIDDQPLSPFPQFNLVERPDSFVAGLIEGKVGVMVDGTPYVFSGPSTFIEFFHTPEDYFNRWLSSSLVRLLRITGILLSITLSALYVAILTYHYEVIPANMLKTIALSRAKVPFPPLYEALFLELTLEVLREAGARLPTKVGQTMGIVGGIVIGQAAVSAGLTSNVMIIVVSLSALTSFVTPSYVMGNAVRVVRFPLILLAGMWGFIGLSVGLLTMLIHLLNLSSLGAPYLAPIAPLRLVDLKDALIRVPSQMLIYRPTFLKPKRNRKEGDSPIKRK